MSSERYWWRALENQPRTLLTPENSILWVSRRHSVGHCFWRWTCERFCVLMDTSVGCRIIFRNAKGSLHPVPGQRPIESSCRDPCSFCCHPSVDRLNLDMIHLHAGFKPTCPTLCLRVHGSHTDNRAYVSAISVDMHLQCPYVASLISRRLRTAQSPRCNTGMHPQPKLWCCGHRSNLAAFQDVSLLEM